MTQVSIRKGIRAVLQPDNDGMNLADRAYQGVVDVIVNHETGDEKAKAGVDTVGQCDVAPGGIACPCNGLLFGRHRSTRLFPHAHNALGRTSCSVLDKIC